MEKKNNRYELIIGFVTLILSFSAFKDELAKVSINLGYYQFSLADYLLVIVYGFGFVVYLSVLEKVARESKRLNSWKFIEYLEKFSFISFVFIILSPIALIISYLCYSLFDNFVKIDSEIKKGLGHLFSWFFGLALGVFSKIISNKYFKNKNEAEITEIEKEEIVELEKVVKLFENHFYSHTIIEAFKVIELQLIKILNQNNYIIPRNRITFQELVRIVEKNGLLEISYLEKINDIRIMRNVAAHLNVEHNEEQALKSIELIKELIRINTHI